jgi:hypothetical protein
VDDDRPVLITIPTELDRADAFVVLSMGAGTILMCWWLLQRGVPPPLVLIPAIVVGVWTLTSRSATEVRVIGSWERRVRRFGLWTVGKHRCPCGR